MIISILILVGIVSVGKKIYSDIHKKNIVIRDWLEENVTITLDNKLGKNIYSVSKSNDINIYNSNYREIIERKFIKLKDSDSYTFENPLIIYNLYGTNKLGINMYFETTEKSNIDYIITVDDQNISEFKRTLKNNVEENLAKEHNYQLIGFVKGYKNNLKLELKNSDGEVVKTKKIEIDLTNIKTDSQVTAKVEEGKSKKEQESGLYTILGNDSDTQDYIAMYDNDGILRSEIPIIGYRGHRMLFKEGSMYFSISQSKIVKMSRTGEVEEIYSTGHYHLHHDYTFDNDGNIIVLANNTKKDTEEDCIIEINLETKEVTELVDFEPMFQSYVDTCYWDKEAIRDEGEDGLDWLHLNSIEYVDGDVFLSSRETSSILKVSNIESNPKLEYIISDKKIWKDTEFSDYVYEKIGDFKIHAGQHSVRYKEGEKDGVYYLKFFDNNYGKATSKPDFDYTKIDITNQNPFQGDKSYYYVYKVDENKKTFELVDSMELVYSGIVSSIQTLNNDNILTDSGTAGVYAEYDKDHNLIKKFTLDLNKYMVYRVLKYDYTELWFD